MWGAAPGQRLRRTGQISSWWCGIPCRSADGTFAVPISMPQYSCMESMFTTSPSSRLASSREIAVLPEAVGPTTAIGRISVEELMETQSSGAAGVIITALPYTRLQGV